MAVYAASPMSRFRDLPWALVATGLVVASFILAGWLAGVVTFVVASGISGLFWRVFTR